MKYSIIFFIALLLGCSPNKAPDKPQEEIPKALEEENSEVRLSSFKSYDSDLVEELFNELKNKNPEYKAIAALLDSISEMRKDSLSKFENYKQKSTTYYSDANINSGSIKDSVLRKNIMSALNRSQKQFDKKTANTLNLIKQINTNEINTSDLYIALKIASTIPLIEKYQNNLDNKAIMALLKKQQELINKLTTENKKRGF